MIQRKTVQITMVKDVVMSLHNHPTADEIYALVKERCPSISRATVYRNLQQLCESGGISRREIPNSADRYDNNTTDHYHIMCNKCGKVVDVGMDYMQGLDKLVKDSNGFDISGYDIVFKGLCPDCKKK